MKHSELTTSETASEAASLYDRFADLYDLTFKFNRYGRSVDRLLRDISLPLSSGAHILDAGCGTGLLTLSMLRMLDRPARIHAIDLSSSSIIKARKAVNQTKVRRKHRVFFTQANLLSLPFADETFDFVATSGALEYVPLEDGLRELARVIAPGGYLLHIPVRPSFASRLLELMFRFKTHPPQEVDHWTSHYFHTVEHYCFPPLNPISWTKTAIVAQKQ